MTVAPSISDLDVRALWHPLTQHKPLADNPPPLMVRGDGCYLEDDQGRRYLDAMAGLWWCQHRPTGAANWPKPPPRR